MNIVSSFSNYAAFFFNDRILNLRAQNRKILIIATCALGFFAACYAVGHYYYFRGSRSEEQTPKLEDATPKLEESKPKLEDSKPDAELDCKLDFQENPQPQQFDIKALNDMIIKKLAEMPKQEIPTTNLDRKYPPVSSIDTMINGIGAHGTTVFFNDEDILEIHQVIKRELIQEKNDYQEEVFIEYTSNNKPIIQQQAVRGCTAAAACMLIADAGGKVDPYDLLCNLGNTESMKRLIEKAGYEQSVQEISSKDSRIRLQELSNMIAQDGSAIVSVSSEHGGGHVMVVDEISSDFERVRLRDPYHGWEITVKAEAFSQYFDGGDVVQIR